MSPALAACAVVAGMAAPRPTSPPPTPLPTAIPPQSSPEYWVLPYMYSFPPEFWSPGRHNYSFRILCPELGYSGIQGAWRSFAVFEDAPGQARPTTYLRPVGLSTRPLGDPNRYYIDPVQPTVALVSFIGLGRQQAESLAASPDCTASIQWDDGIGSRDLAAGTPYLP
jgi:hypothetical protein